MDEVDIDKSHSLDFYEYLLVVDKVTKKSGKRTTLFHYPPPILSRWSVIFFKICSLIKNKQTKQNKITPKIKNILQCKRKRK